jgi:hypothetical protein
MTVPILPLNDARAAAARPDQARPRPKTISVASASDRRLATVSRPCAHGLHSGRPAPAAARDRAQAMAVLGLPSTWTAERLACAIDRLSRAILRASPVPIAFWDPAQPRPRSGAISGGCQSEKARRGRRPARRGVHLQGALDGWRGSTRRIRIPCGPPRPSLPPSVAPIDAASMNRAAIPCPRGRGTGPGPLPCE